MPFSVFAEMKMRAMFEWMNVIPNVYEHILKYVEQIIKSIPKLLHWTLKNFREFWLNLIAQDESHVVLIPM